MKRICIYMSLILSSIVVAGNSYAACSNTIENGGNSLSWFETVYYPQAGFETCLYMDAADTTQGVVSQTELGGPNNIGNYSRITSAEPGTAEYCVSSAAYNCN